MSLAHVLEADLTWTDEGFRSGVRIAVNAEGRIEAVGDVPLHVDQRLRGRAIIPGGVNAHSHAFQRGLRGLGETFPAGAGSFWTWREAMYALVEAMTPERFLALTTRAYREMRRAGWTTVGEFHYLRHSPDTIDGLYDALLLEAARDAGIRLVVIPAYYATGGVGQPLGPAQQRFATPTPDVYWTLHDRLATRCDATQTLGAAVHSIRAATIPDLMAVATEARRRGLVFHMHVEEQRREIDDCIAAYGRTPMRVLLDTVPDAHHVTAVHCTHTAVAERTAFHAAGGRSCINPLTEGNLGDGIPALDRVPATGLCIGTDSNARLDLAEEIRWLEYGQRLRRQARGLLPSSTGHPWRTGFAAATGGGADALGIPAGRIIPGAWADFAVLDLHGAALAEVPPDHLLEGWITGADSSVVTATCVGGRWDVHRPGVT